MISYTKIFSFLFLFTTVQSILVHTTLGDLPIIIWWTISFILILLVFKLKPLYYTNHEKSKGIIVVQLLLFWNIICIIRGSFVAENYWEYKNLVNTSFVMLIPLFVFLFINKDFTQKIISFWLKYMLIIFFIFVPFLTFTDFSGRYLTPILLLLLVFPILSTKWKIITLFFTLFVIITGLDARSNIIRFSVAFSLGLIYYLRFIVIDKFLKFFHIILISLPIILLLLSLLNIFNIFKINTYIKGNYSANVTFDGKQKKESLTADTRTFIYKETITSAIKNNYILFGRTPANGYDSVYFGDFLKYELGTGKQQRFSSEVSILNIFTWNGILGVFLYFLVFLTASSLAIYKSNNYFIKIIGLFVAFRWAYGFVEDFTSFDIQYIFLWMLIAMCFSNSFRKMNNNEFENWIKNLLKNTSLIKLRK